MVLCHFSIDKQNDNVFHPAHFFMCQVHNLSNNPHSSLVSNTLPLSYLHESFLSSYSGDKNECLSHLDAVRTGLGRTPEQFSSQQVSVVLEEGQVQVPEKLHVLVLHTQLLGRIPVDHLKPVGGVTKYFSHLLYYSYFSSVTFERKYCTFYLLLVTLVTSHRANSHLTFNMR